MRSPAARELARSGRGGCARGGRSRSPASSADAEFLAVEGLGDEVVGAGLDAADDVGLVGPAGEHDDVDVVRRAADCADALDELHARTAAAFPSR